MSTAMPDQHSPNTSLQRALSVGIGALVMALSYALFSVVGLDNAAASRYGALIAVIAILLPRLISSKTTGAKLIAPAWGIAGAVLVLVIFRSVWIL